MKTIFFIKYCRILSILTYCLINCFIYMRYLENWSPIRHTAVVRRYVSSTVDVLLIKICITNSIKYLYFRMTNTTSELNLCTHMYLDNDIFNCYVSNMNPNLIRLRQIKTVSGHMHSFTFFSLQNEAKYRVTLYFMTNS